MWLLNGRENAAPDYYDLGVIQQGARVELSARLLVRNHPGDEWYDALLRKAPAAWKPRLSKWHPRRFRKKEPAIDVNTLRPIATSSSFIRLERVTPEQRKEWYDGRPFVVAKFTLNTSIPGEYDGAVDVRLPGRRSALPVRFIIQAVNAAEPQLLIAETPFEADTTDDGRLFRSVKDLSSSLPCSTDFLFELPSSSDDDLSKYAAILLNGSPLSSGWRRGFPFQARMITQPAVETPEQRMSQYLEGGGTLILSCNYFMRGSVTNANRILAGHGLEVRDADYGKGVTVTNIVTDPLTRDVRRLEFFRPSLITVTDDTKARILAFAPTNAGGFVAAARTPQGGQILVLGTSLWWNWIHEYRDNSDNYILMSNLLVHAVAYRKSTGNRN